ncbi:putative transposase [Burkholderia oklahomensis]|uniref:Transposase n=1 Tax=Burkholderia oklahomensis TaxID=342113 RepID=A0AAI8FLY7_9BURK|nr:putative transposase [Burkholderia oklahomensis]
MQRVALVGIDLGRHSFHLHGRDRHGKAVFRKKVSRKQWIECFAAFHACKVVREACAGRANWPAPGSRSSSSRRNSCVPSSRATRTASWMPRRSVRRLRARPCALSTEGRIATNAVSTASGSRIADPRPHEGRQPDAWLSARIRHRPADRSASRQEHPASAGAMRSCLHAAARPPERSIGRLGAHHAHATARQCGRLRVGKQAHAYR